MFLLSFFYELKTEILSTPESIPSIFRSQSQKTLKTGEMPIKVFISPSAFVILKQHKFFTNEIRSNFQQTFYKKSQKLYGANEAGKFSRFQQ